MRCRANIFCCWYILAEVVCQEQLAIAPISSLFNNNKEHIGHDSTSSVKSIVQSRKRIPPPGILPTVDVPTPMIVDQAIPISQNGIRSIPPSKNQALHQRAKAPNPAGKPNTRFPKHYELYRMIPQTVELCYKAVATFAYACFFLVRDDFLVWDDGTDMRPTLACVNTKWYKMVKQVLNLRDYDFSWLIKPREGYAEQESISGERVKAQTACAIHYGNDLGLVARYLDMETGEITGAWRNVQGILGAAAGLVTTAILSAMERILTRGCPAYFNWEEPAENKEAFLMRGNNPSIDQHPELVGKTINKEERNGHILAFEDFIVWFSAFARTTPQHIINKIGKTRNYHE